MASPKLALIVAMTNPQLKTSREVELHEVWQIILQCDPRKIGACTGLDVELINALENARLIGTENEIKRYVAEAFGYIASWAVVMQRATVRDYEGTQLSTLLAGFEEKDEPAAEPIPESSTGGDFLLTPLEEVTVDNNSPQEPGPEGEATESQGIHDATPYR